MFPITTLTSSILAGVYVAMSIKVIQLRRTYRVSVGADGHKDLEMLIRAHGNFSEYVPLTLILLLCAEANNIHWIPLLIIALLFLAGRLFHAYAFIYNLDHFKHRVRGMKLTFLCLVALAILNILLLLIHL
ncbi:MAG: glutathione S-transferase [Legionella sp.]|nr:MAG: glutathione S-transferase [Legionella sp.]